MSAVLAAIDAARWALSAGLTQNAKSILQRALKRDAADPDLCNAMAQVLVHLKERDQAVYYAHRACRARPGEDAFVTTFSWAVAIGRKPEEVVAHLENAIAKDPADPALRFAACDGYLALSRPGDAARHSLEGTAHAPDHVPLAVKGLTALLRAARVPELIGLARRTLERAPGQMNTALALSFAMNYADPPDLAAILRAHLDVGEALERATPRERIQFGNSRDPDRPLRVGLLSADLHTHSVAYFVEPLLRHRDPGAIEVWCYSTSADSDAVTERFKSLAAGWRQVESLDDAAVAAHVRADSIDLLLDLSGHTRSQRLPVFLNAPAPLTGTWIGYPNTTGLRAVGRRFVDSHTDPSGADRWCVEKLVRLDPCFLCYQPPDAPDPAPAPCTLPGAPGVTFGSFNTLTKVNDSVLGSWASVLARVPGSRLVIKAPQFSETGVREHTLARCAAAGIDPSRVTILGRVQGLGAHLAQYAMIDIALDPFPYCGTTTTCEALWMGVPVVTAGGPTHASRVGVSLLNAAGLPELIAPDRAAYVDLCERLARDPTRLAALRSGMRERVRNSVLCGGAAYARRFESAVRSLWREYLGRG